MTDCSICLEELKDASTLITLHSSHQFHVECMLKWISSTEQDGHHNNKQCPLCRQDLLQHDYENLANGLLMAFRQTEQQQQICIDGASVLIELLWCKFEKADIARNVFEQCLIERYDVKQIPALTLTFYAHMLHEEFNEYAEAVKYFGAAIENDSRCNGTLKMIKIPFYIGIIKELHLNQKFEEVVKHYQEALNSDIPDPDDVTVELRARLKSLCNQLLSEHDGAECAKLNALRWHLSGLLMESYYSFLCYTKSMSFDELSLDLKVVGLHGLAKYFAACNDIDGECKCYDQILALNCINTESAPYYFHAYSRIIAVEAAKIIRRGGDDEIDLHIVDKIGSHVESVTELVAAFRFGCLDSDSWQLSIEFMEILIINRSLYQSVLDSPKIQQIEEEKQKYAEKLEAAVRVVVSQLMSFAWNSCETGCLDEAQRFIQQALTVLEDHEDPISELQADCWIMLGTVHQRRQEWPAAILCFDKVVQLHPEAVHVLLSVAQSYAKMGAVQQETNVLRCMIEQIENNEERKANHSNLRALLTAYRDLGDFESDPVSAQMYYEKLLEVLEQTETEVAQAKLATTVSVLNSLGWNLHVEQKKDFERAKGLYERALRMDGGEQWHPVCHSYAHLMHYHYKDLVTAKKYYELAIALDEEGEDSQQYEEDYKKLQKEMNVP